MAQRGGVSNSGCYRCGKDGHFSKNCPSSSARNYGCNCFYCGEPGHQKRDCPQVNRRSSGAKPNNPAAAETSSSSSAKTPTHPASAVPFIDTHCHLEYVLERTRHLNRGGNFGSFRAKMAYPENYEGCITTFCDSAALSPSLGMWRELLSEEGVWGSFGVHPHNAKYYSDSLQERLVRCLEHPRCVAFGEVGLDYSRHTESDGETQRNVLRRQLDLAVGLVRKPLLIHCRDAEEDLLELLSAAVPSDWKIHLHCFTGKLALANKFLDSFPNLFIGVTGIVTMETDRCNNNVRQIAAELPLERLLLETDAPYNVPRNLPKSHAPRCPISHPAFITHIAEEVADLRQTSLDDVLRETRKNAKSLYGI